MADSTNPRARQKIQVGARVSVAPSYFYDELHKERYYGKVISKIGSSLRVKWDGEQTTSLVDVDDIIEEPVKTSGLHLLVAATNLHEAKKKILDSSPEVSDTDFNVEGTDGE